MLINLEILSEMAKDNFQGGKNEGQRSIKDYADDVVFISTS